MTGPVTMNAVTSHNKEIIMNGNFLRLLTSGTGSYINANTQDINIIHGGGKPDSCINLGVYEGGFVQVRNVDNNAFGILKCKQVIQSESSIRYKENVIDMDEERALNLLKLRTVSFNYKGKSEEELGFIAEEVAEIDKYMVYYEKGIPESIIHKNFIPQIIKLLQIHDERIKKLES